MSPVCSMNSGATGKALILVTAACSVETTSGFAGLLKPMWLSLIWTKLNSPAACWCEASLRLYDLSTPPWSTHRAPVPAQAMHFRNPRRSIPSWLWSNKISLLRCGIVVSCMDLLRDSMCLTADAGFYSTNKKRNIYGAAGIKRAPAGLPLCACRKRACHRGRSNNSPCPISTGSITLPAG